VTSRRRPPEARIHTLSGSGPVTPINESRFVDATGIHVSRTMNLLRAGSEALVAREQAAIPRTDR
jgi:hypothetical protein